MTEQTQTSATTATAVAPTVNLSHESTVAWTEMAAVVVVVLVAVWFLWRRLISPKTRGCSSCGKSGGCASRRPPSASS